MGEEQLTLPGMEVPSPKADWQPDLPIIGDQADMEKVVGRPLPKGLFDLAPWGHRLVVVREAPKGFRRITRDDGTEVQLEIPNPDIPTTGWVVSVGDRVGLGRPDFAGHCPFDRRQLIGKKVLFGQWVGSPLQFDERGENEYESLYTILLDGDVWGTVGD